ncbi:MAG TPA: MarR family transcriptional regulator [Xanthobacteraceae bacterium]|nr:MarR family transcriptional regulator [Xanthobacteraceae bacterium]
MASPGPHGADDAIDYGPLAHWVAFHLRMAQVVSFQAFARLAHGENLSPGRFAVLTLIGQNPGISQTALSRANRNDKSTLTSALRGLVQKKLVNRQRAAGDKRLYRLTLTAAGEKLLRRLTECAKQHDRNLMRVIGPRDYAHFMQILQKIANEIG